MELSHKKSSVVYKKSFITSDDPQWWKEVYEKVEVLKYHLSSDTMHYFAEDLQSLLYITATPYDLDLEIIGMFKVTDPEYYMDYLNAMSDAALNQDGETFIYYLDELLDYIDSMTPKEAGMKKAQEEFIDWESIQSSVKELWALSNRRNPRAFMEELDYLNTIMMNHIQMPDDLSPEEIDPDFK